MTEHVQDSTTSSLNSGTSSGYMTPRNLVTGKVGKGLDFDGVNDYVDCGSDSSLDIGTNVTWAWWMKWNGNSGNYKGIIARGTISNAYSIRINGVTGVGDKLEFRFYGIQTLSSNITPSQDWEFWTIVKTERNFKFYRNSIYIIGMDANQDIVNSGSLRIANYEGYQYFSGLIDEVHIYKQCVG